MMLTSLSVSSSTNVVKTTMTVRLHPGKVEEQLQKEEEVEEVEDVEEVVEVGQPMEEDTDETGDTLVWSDKHNPILSSPNTGREKDPDL